MDKKNVNIFLSASIPLEKRDPKYFQSADVVAIRDAVIALTRVSMERFHLIWGGHPSITPLIADVIEHYGKDVRDCVTLYQSSFWDGMFPPENRIFANIIKTENKHDQRSSLRLMRHKMIVDNEFHAGVFIGGMEGIEDEFNLFLQSHPHAIVLPIASTGAAAKLLYDKSPDAYDSRLLNDMCYYSLFKDLLL